MEKKPIGIFDSGVGGLTVYKAIREAFPYEDIVYFGDTARVPYGPKSPQTVIDYSLQNARFLMQFNAKIVIVACNTSSAVAIEQLIAMLNIPVLEVIKPGARAAVKATKNGAIGVIGTFGTIKSKAYEKAIHALMPEAIVHSAACPLFVPLVEEGMEQHQATKIIAEEYLAPFLCKGIDTLVLGCTHYPVLKKTLQQITNESVTLIDSAVEIARGLKNILPDPQSSIRGNTHFFVSDNEEKFQEIASRILNGKIDSLTKVRLGESWYV